MNWADARAVRRSLYWWICIYPLFLLHISASYLTTMITYHSLMMWSIWRSLVKVYSLSAGHQTRGKREEQTNFEWECFYSLMLYFIERLAEANLIMLSLLEHSMRRSFQWGSSQSRSKNVIIREGTASKCLFIHSLLSIPLGTYHS